MRIAGLDIVFAGKPRIPVAREADLPLLGPAPPPGAQTIVRHAAVLPLSWIAEGVSCEVVVDFEGVDGPVAVTPHVVATNAGLSLAPRQIAPADIQDGRCTVRFPLACDHLASDGVNEYFVQWDWVCSSGAATFSLGVSDHLLFVTLRPPSVPWSLDDAAPNCAFGLALRTACRFGRGQAHDRALVSGLLLALRNLGESFTRVRYSGDTTEYILLGSSSPQFFDCRGLLTDLWSGHPQPIDLCCIEFACLLVALANVAGCTTARAVMHSGADCDTFESVAVQPLGGTVLKTFEFCHHEVCVIRGSMFGPESLAFDAPFLVHLPGANGAPAALREVDGIPLGLPTSSVGEHVYLPHLVASTAIAGVMTFEAEPPDLVVPQEAPAPACIQKKTDRLRAELSTVKLPITFPVERFILTDLVPLRTVDVPSREPVPETSLRRTWFVRTGAKDPAVQMDVWRSSNPAALTEFIAHYVASREVAYSRQDVNGVPTFVSSSGASTIQLQRGAVVRLLRLSGAAPELFTLAGDTARLRLE
jgi:hypothetical protein